MKLSLKIVLLCVLSIVFVGALTHFALTRELPDSDALLELIKEDIARNNGDDSATVQIICSNLRAMDADEYSAALSGTPPFGNFSVIYRVGYSLGALRAEGVGADAREALQRYELDFIEKTASAPRVYESYILVDFERALFSVRIKAHAKNLTQALQEALYKDYCSYERLDALMSEYLFGEENHDHTLAMSIYGGAKVTRCGSEVQGSEALFKALDAMRTAYIGTSRVSLRAKDGAMCLSLSLPSYEDGLFTHIRDFLNPDRQLAYDAAYEFLRRAQSDFTGTQREYPLSSLSLGDELNPELCGALADIATDEMAALERFSDKCQSLYNTIYTKSLPFPESDIQNPSQTLRWVSTVTLINSLGANAYVKFSGADGVYTAHLRPGQSVNVKLPKGDYRVTYSYWHIWYGDELCFGPQGNYRELPAPIVSKPLTLYTLHLTRSANCEKIHYNTFKNIT